MAQEQLAAVRDHLATESNLWGRSVRMCMCMCVCMCMCRLVYLLDSW